MELLGWAGTLLFLIGGFFKSPKHTMATYFTADILYVVMYLSAALYVPAISMGIVCLRTLGALFLSDETNKRSVYALTALTVVILMVTMTHIMDVLIILASLSIAASQLYRDHLVKFRLSLLGSQVLWIIHSLYFDVPSMLVTCLLVSGSCIYSLIVHTGLWHSLRSQISQAYAARFIKLSEV